MTTLSMRFIRKQGNRKVFLWWVTMNNELSTNCKRCRMILDGCQQNVGNDILLNKLVHSIDGIEYSLENDLNYNSL